jgi:hypothetical protein
MNPRKGILKDALVSSSEVIAEQEMIASAVTAIAAVATSQGEIDGKLLPRPENKEMKTKTITIPPLPPSPEQVLVFCMPRLALR